MKKLTTLLSGLGLLAVLATPVFADDAATTGATKTETTTTTEKNMDAAKTDTAAPADAKPAKHAKKHKKHTKKTTETTDSAASSEATK